MRETPHTEIALDALKMAVERQRLAPGVIHHSDRGIQYAAEAYRQALASAGITPSMSRKGDRWDNAPMESFFHTLKTERVHHRVYATRDQARRDLFGYIEGFYNPRRLHSALGYISPADADQSGLTPSLFRGKITTCRSLATISSGLVRFPIRSSAGPKPHLRWITSKGALQESWRGEWFVGR